VKSVGFSRDGNKLLTSGDDKIIKLWNINYVKGADLSRRSTGHGFVRSFTGHTDWVLDSKFSPDNRVIGSVCTKSVRLWDIATGSEIVNFKHVGLQNTSVSFHPDGNYLAVGSENRHIKIWDMRSQKLVQDYLLPSAVTSLDFHPSGVVLASSQLFDAGLNNSSLNLFDIRQARCVFEIQGIQDSLNSVCFSRDGEYITAGGKNKLVYVWKSNLQLKPPQAAPEEFEPRPDKEVDIGGAISLQKHLQAYEDRDKNEVYEQISTSLEDLVLKINRISESARINQKPRRSRLPTARERTQNEQALQLDPDQRLHLARSLERQQPFLQDQLRLALRPAQRGRHHPLRPHDRLQLQRFEQTGHHGQ
jgi:hypothetical protein